MFRVINNGVKFGLKGTSTTAIASSGLFVRPFSYATKIEDLENSVVVPGSTEYWEEKIQSFQRDVRTHLGEYEPSRVVIASAWLVSDNVLVDLFAKYAPEHFPTVVGIDTMHLFPSTLELVEQMKEKYGFEPKVYKPTNCDSYEDFVRLYGHHSKLSHADFDKHSKIDPLMKGFEDARKQIAITGRRADQGSERISLDIFEADKATFNPLANWSWEDVCEYVMRNDVPYNDLHRTLSISKHPVPATERDGYDFKTIKLEKPYFAYSKAEIDAHGDSVYIWKSFGDVHTTVPVSYNESERSGRFVGRLQTECGIHTRISEKGAPHGGKLVNRVTNPESLSFSLEPAAVLNLTERQICDFECIANGSFSPLTGFMTKLEYDTVIAEMRMPEGQLFGLPVTLDTDNESLKEGDLVELRNPETGAYGVMRVENKWIPDRSIECQEVYGTTNTDHPAVNHLMNEKGKYNIGGPVWAFTLPTRDWVNCLTPLAVRFKNMGKNKIAFQSRNPLHRAHVTMLLTVAEKYDADVLVHPVVGPTKDDDIPAIVRKETYDCLDNKFDHVQFEYLPYNMMLGGAREALQHAIVRKNYGCSGIIIGRDHAGCKDRDGNDFYEPYEAQELLQKLESELGMDIILFEQMVYVGELDKYIPNSEAEEKGLKPMKISGTQFRNMLLNNEDIPDWFAYPEVVKILRRHARSN